MRFYSLVDKGEKQRSLYSNYLSMDLTSIQITYQQNSNKNGKIDFEHFLIVLRKIAA